MSDHDGDVTDWRGPTVSKVVIWETNLALFTEGISVLSLFGVQSRRASLRGLQIGTETNVVPERMLTAAR